MAYNEQVLQPLLRIILFKKHGIICRAWRESDLHTLCYDSSLCNTVIQQSTEQRAGEVLRQRVST